MADARADFLEPAARRGLVQYPLRLALGAVLRRIEQREALADDLGRLVAGDRLGTDIPGRDDAPRIERGDRKVGHAVDEQA